MRTTMFLSMRKMLLTTTVVTQVRMTVTINTDDHDHQNGRNQCSHGDDGRDGHNDYTHKADDNGRNGRTDHTRTVMRIFRNCEIYH